ncbi:MAG: hypothetical protein HUU28_13030 [Planctomycetaceae bacterium]|jgi:hypothetical protein|nr:hypothetical protein [Planctomycetaceae bacterium]
MKLLALPLVALSSLLWLAPSEVHAPDSQERRREEKREGGHEEHSPLEERMHAMEDSIRALRRSLKDPAKQAESLALVAKLEADILAAKGETPRLAPKVPEAERAKFLVDYRLEMIGMLEHTIALEKALLAGAPEAVTAAFEKLRALEDPAHARFTEEEK